MNFRTFNESLRFTVFSYFVSYIIKFDNALCIPCCTCSFNTCYSIYCSSPFFCELHSLFSFPSTSFFIHPFSSVNTLYQGPGVGCGGCQQWERFSVEVPLVTVEVPGHASPTMVAEMCQYSMSRICV